MLYFLKYWPAQILKPFPNLESEFEDKKNNVVAKWGKVQTQLFQLLVEHQGEVGPACDFSNTSELSSVSP